MGCCCCCASDLQRIIPAEWYAQFKALRLTDSEIRRFLALYQNIDMDRSGAIDLQELLNYMDIENTSFTNRAFSVFDLNNSGKVDFREFVLAVWNYCTLGAATLGKYPIPITLSNNITLIFVALKRCVCV
jgi:hypothetical protein